MYLTHIFSSYFRNLFGSKLEVNRNHCLLTSYYPFSLNGQKPNNGNIIFLSFSLSFCLPTTNLPQPILSEIHLNLYTAWQWWTRNLRSRRINYFGHRLLLSSGDKIFALTYTPRSRFMLHFRLILYLSSPEKLFCSSHLLYLLTEQMSTVSNVCLRDCFYSTPSLSLLFTCFIRCRCSVCWHVFNYFTYARRARKKNCMGMCV